MNICNVDYSRLIEVPHSTSECYGIARGKWQQEQENDAHCCASHSIDGEDIYKNERPPQSGNLITAAGETRREPFWLFDMSYCQNDGGVPQPFDVGYLSCDCGGGDGVCWLLLAVPACAWLLLAVAGRCWLLLPGLGCVWLPLFLPCFSAF